MTKPSLKMEDVIKFFNHYHKKVKTNPGLYQSTDTTATIILPAYLLAFAEFSSGHSGFKAGARPLGIRRHGINSAQFVTEVFATPENLAAFIRSSACDAFDHVTGKAIPPQPKDTQPRKVKVTHEVSEQFVPAKELFWSKYGASDLAFLRNKYSADLVNRAMGNLTMTEMQNLFMF